jgi:hypothetical protein
MHWEILRFKKEKYIKIKKEMYAIVNKNILMKESKTLPHHPCPCPREEAGHQVCPQVGMSVMELHLWRGKKYLFL